MGVACCLSLSDGDDIMIRKLSLSITLCILCLIEQGRETNCMSLFLQRLLYLLYTHCNKIMSKLESLKEAQTERVGRDMRPFVMINCKTNVFIIISCTLQFFSVALVHFSNHPCHLHNSKCISQNNSYK